MQAVIASSMDAASTSAITFFISVFLSFYTSGRVLFLQPYDDTALRIVPAEHTQERLLKAQIVLRGTFRGAF